MTRDEVRALRDAARMRPGHSPVAWIPTKEHALRYMAVRAFDHAADDSAISAEFEQRWPGETQRLLSSTCNRELWELGRNRQCARVWSAFERTVAEPGQMLERLGRLRQYRKYLADIKAWRSA